MTNSDSDIDEPFISRLRILISRVGSASALVRQTKISTSGFQKYLSGGEPTRRVLIGLAEAAQVRLEWLMTGSGPMELDEQQTWPQNQLTLLPLYRDEEDVSPETAQDGSREKLVQLAFCREWLADHGYDSAHLATKHVEGDSMAPTFVNGDTLVVDCNERKIIDGKIYVLRDGDSFLIKRLQRGLGGKILLLADNPLYPPIQADLSQLCVVGSVIWRSTLL